MILFYDLLLALIFNTPYIQASKRHLGQVVELCERRVSHQLLWGSLGDRVQRLNKNNIKRMERKKEKEK
jgi:hypothetical protein